MLRKIILFNTAAIFFIGGCLAVNSEPEPTSTPQIELTQTITLENKLVLVTPTSLPVLEDQNEMDETSIKLEMSTPDYLPQPGDENLHSETAFIDLAEIIPQQADNEITLHIIGSLPTPCNQLRVEISSPDKENRVNVTVYSLIETDIICAQVLAQFDEMIRFDLPHSGLYILWINDKQLGEVTVP